MNPSLLLIPDRYKAAKLYSQIPDSGAGDLTFARNSNATRVNSAGLIEKVRTNVKIQSEALTTAAGGLSFTDITTITANTTETLDPFGTSKAEKFDGTIGQVADTYDAISTFVPNTSSIYAKAGTASSFDLRMSGAFSAAANAVFNLSNGTVTSSGGGELISSKIEFVGNGWYRCSISYNFTSVPTNRIALTANGNVYFFGWQLEATDFGATPYIPTTTAAVSVGITADIPRLDYTGGGCPSLLLEPQRTNLINFSEQLNNAYWTPNGATISANSTIAPDGTISMDRLTETATSGNHSVGSTAVTIFSNQVRTNSVFVKKGNVRYIQLISNAFSDSSCSAIFDLDTKTVTNFRASSAAGPVFAYVNSGVEDYGNGILRLFLTNTSTFDNTTFHINHSNVATFAAGTLTDGFITYSGSASLFTDLWGAQVEIGSYPTSYIPTLGSSVTRLADTASKTGISSLIGQTSGTLYVEADLTHSAAFNEYLIQVSADSDNRFFIYREGTTNKLGCFARVGASTIYTTLTASAATGTIKAAFAYQSGSFAFYVNGVQVGTSSATYATPSSMGRFDLDQNDGTENGFYSYNGAGLYTTRLSNAELQSLTSL